MKNLIPRSLAAALLLLTSFVAASAQAKTPKANNAAAQTTQAGDLQKFRQDFIKAAEDYRASLQELATSYEGHLKKTRERQGQLKGPYTDGLTSRVESEARQKPAADAPARAADG